MTQPAPPPDALAALQRVTDAALAYLPLDELLLELLDRIAEILRSDTAAFLLLDEGDRRARRARGQGHRGGGRAGRADPGRAAASPGGSPPSGAAIVIADVDHADILNPILREKGIRSLLGVPLLVEGRVIGVLHVGTLTPREFSDADRDLLQLAADRAATAIEHARLFQQRRVVEVLQRSSCPEALPDVPGRRAGRPLPPGRAARRHRRRLVRRLHARPRRGRAGHRRRHGPRHRRRPR